MPTLNPMVFVLDTDVAVRAALEVVTHRAGWTTETLGSAGMLLARPPLPVPSCLVLNIGLPDLAGLDLLRRFVVERKETPIIAIADHGDIPMSVGAMRAGAVEFLVKPLADEALFPATYYALDRSRAVLDQMAGLRDLRRRYDSLSARQREVLTRVVAGDLNKRIGATLGISEITVKAHRGKVMRKMAAESLAELVTMALRLDLPTVPPRHQCRALVSPRWLWHHKPNARRGEFLVAESVRYEG